MRNWTTWAALIACTLLLSGCSGRYCLFFCHNETSIQGGYVDARNDCQSEAQRQIRRGNSNADPKAYNAELLSAFAQCMKSKGWGVTSPKKTNSRPGGPNDNTQLSGNPWDPTPYGIQRQPAPQQPYGVQQYPAQPQPYGYAPAQPAPQAYGNYGAYPMQQPQAYGYAPPPPAAPQPQYQYSAPPPVMQAPQAPQAYGYQPPPAYGGYYGPTDPNAIAPNRAGIGIAPGFAN